MCNASRYSLFGTIRKGYRFSGLPALDKVEVGAVIPGRVGRGVIRVKVTGAIVCPVINVTTPPHAANLMRVHEVRGKTNGQNQHITIPLRDSIPDFATDVRKIIVSIEF